ncbi:MAG: hypothetical protein ACE365_06600 [Gammaproteobacteria bacterium]
MMQIKKYICSAVMLSVIGLSVWAIVELVRRISGDPVSDWENSGCVKAGGYHDNTKNLWHCSSGSQPSAELDHWSCTLFSNVTVNNNGTILDCQQECVDDCDAYSENTLCSIASMLLGGIAFVLLYNLTKLMQDTYEPTDDQVGLMQPSADEEMQVTTADSETDYRLVPNNSEELPGSRSAFKAYPSSLTF